MVFLTNPRPTQSVIELCLNFMHIIPYIQVDMLNRTTEVDLSNYVENGEWYLVSIKIHRNVVRTLATRPISSHYMIEVYYVKISASGNPSLKSFSHSVGVLCLLSRAISGCDIYSEYQTSHPLLPLQCHIPVYNDVGPHAARLLSAA